MEFFKIFFHHFIEKYPFRGTEILLIFVAPTDQRKKERTRGGILIMALGGIEELAAAVREAEGEALLSALDSLWILSSEEDNRHIMVDSLNLLVSLVETIRNNK